MQNIKQYSILFVCKWFPNKIDKFQGFFIYQHAKAISKNHLVSVISVTPEPDISAKIASFDISNEQNLFIVKAYYQNKFKYLPLISTFIKIFLYYYCLFKSYLIIKKAEYKPDLVHINVLTRPVLLAWYLKIFFGIKYVITEHWTGYMPQDGRYKGLFKKLFTKLAIKFSSAVTTVSESLKNYMLSHGLKGNYIVIENIIEKPSTLKHSIKEAKIIAVNVSDLVDEMKNVSGIIKIIPDVLKKFNDFELHIIGKGDDEQRLIEYSKSLNLFNTAVFFHRPMPHSDLLLFLSKSSFLIVNSNFETFSVVAAEALSCGLPVIVTKCGGPEEFVNQENGCVIEVENEVMLTNAILSLSNKLGTFVPENISENILNKFGAEKIAEKFNSLYHKVLNHR